MSIIEVVLALAILAMAALIFLPVFSQGMEFTKEIRDYSVLVGMAEQLTHGYIVRINNLAPTDPPINFFEDNVTASVKAAMKNPVLDGLPDFKVLSTVRPSLLCEKGGYEIIIKMTWESGGRPKEFSLLTVKAVRGI